MRRMYSENQIKTIAGAVATEIVNGAVPHFYSLTENTGDASTGKDIAIYIASSKNITSAGDLVSEDINGKVIGVSYYEYASGANDNIYVGLSHFSTNESGVITFHRIKDSDGEYAGITATNIDLETLKTYTLTKLV